MFILVIFLKENTRSRCPPEKKVGSEIQSIDHLLIAIHVVSKVC